MKSRDYKGPSSDGDGDGLPLVAHALREEGADAGEDGTGRGTPIVAFTQNQEGSVLTGAISASIGTNQNASGRNTPKVFNGRVRRLTVEEAEALQGFPRRYTAVPYKGKPMADGPRYRMLGNSMAVNVMRWIGERIALVEEIKHSTVIG